MPESMPLVKVRCPACNKKLGFPEQSAGKKARCPGCQQSFRIELPPVPSPTSQPVIPPRPATSDLVAVQCPACNKKLRFPASAAGREARCPGCQERFPIPAATSAPTTPQAPADEEPDSLYDILATAEQSAPALAEQPIAPSGFVAPGMPQPTAIAPGTATGSGRAAKGSTGAAASAAVERVYGAVGTLAKGCMFSVVGALIGAFVWYGIAKAFSIELGYVAWGVGVLAGMGMHIGVQKESMVAGLLASVFAFGGILAGKLMFVAWVLLPQVNAELQEEANSVENQRSVLVQAESEKILAARNIKPDDATEEQEDSALADAEERIEKLSPSEVRQQYKRYIEKHPEAKAEADVMPDLKEMSTGVLVILLGLLFGFKGLIFVILGMATAFKLGYDGGSFGE